MAVPNYPEPDRDVRSGDLVLVECGDDTAAPGVVLDDEVDRPVRWVMMNGRKRSIFAMHIHRAENQELWELATAAANVDLREEETAG